MPIVGNECISTGSIEKKALAVEAKNKSNHTLKTYKNIEITTLSKQLFPDVQNCFLLQQDLTTVLESELSGATKDVVSALLCSPVTYDVQSLNKAFEVQDYDTIVTIIISNIHRSANLLDIEEQYLGGE